MPDGLARTGFLGMGIFLLLYRIIVVIFFYKNDTDHWHIEGSTDDHFTFGAGRGATCRRLRRALAAVSRPGTGWLSRRLPVPVQQLPDLAVADERRARPAVASGRGRHLTGSGRGGGGLRGQ